VTKQASVCYFHKASLLANHSDTLQENTNHIIPLSPFQKENEINLQTNKNRVKGEQKNP